MRLVFEPTKEITMLEFQIEIEKLFHKHQLFLRFLGVFVCVFVFETVMKEHDIDISFGYDLFVLLVLH